MRVETGPRSRRITGALLLAALLSVAVALAPGGSEAKKRKKGAKQARPNIVLIMDDDQNVEMQRFLSKTNAAIGGKGVTFDNSFVSYSLCCPSRSTMLTGQYAHNHGVRSNQLPTGGYSKLAPTLGNSLPVWLQRSGYYTAHIGKFLNGYGANSPDTEIPPGWNEWYGFLDNPDAFPGGTYTAYGYTLNENGQIVHYGSTPDAVVPPYQIDLYSQKATDFIRRLSPGRKPFYLALAPRDPHSEAASCNCAGNNPRAAPRYEGTLAGLSAPRDPSFNEADVSDKPSNIKNLPSLTPTQISNVDARYRARAESLLGVDDLVQNVVSTLAASGELKNTVLIFTSDNGFFHGEHRVPNGKVRLYEPSIRVPLLIRAPGIPKGVHRRQPVSNVDLAPTILDFARATAGRNQDGMSLVPIMEKKRDFPGRGLELEAFFNTADTSEDPEDPPLNYRGVRTDRYLYAEYGTAEQELYDLRNDTFELQNAITNPAYAQVRAALQRLLGGLVNCAGKACRGKPALKLKVRRCSTARVAGKGRPQEATFYLRGKKIRTDAKPPIQVKLRNPSNGQRLESVASSIDGRTVSLTRKLRGC
jgi:N-acetylglucosamine-6-sulfatase